MPSYRYSGPTDCKAPIDTSNLAGKVAIVTGGANGIGEAYVRALVDAGASVCVGDLDTSGGEQLSAELPNVKFVRYNTTVWEDQIRLFDTAKTLSPSGTISYVIANAGICTSDEVYDVRSGESRQF